VAGGARGVEQWVRIAVARDLGLDGISRTGSRASCSANPNGARALRGKQVGNKQAVAAVKANADRRATSLASIVDDLRAKGTTSVRAIATELNAQGIMTPRGGQWHSTSVHRLLARST